MSFLGTIIDGLGSVVNRVQGVGSMSQQDYNSAEAATNRRFQEYMSNTAHSREVRDLIDAGINPAITALGGNGAPSAGGSTAQTSAGGSGILNSVLNAAVTLHGQAINRRQSYAAFNTAQNVMKEMRSSVGEVKKTANKMNNYLTDFTNKFY